MCLLSEWLYISFFSVVIKYPDEEQLIREAVYFGLQLQGDGIHHGRQNAGTRSHMTTLHQHSGNWEWTLSGGPESLNACLQGHTSISNTLPPKGFIMVKAALSVGNQVFWYMDVWGASYNLTTAGCEDGTMHGEAWLMVNPVWMSADIMMVQGG